MRKILTWRRQHGPPPRPRPAWGTPKIASTAAVRSSRESGARLEKLIGNGGLAGARWSVRVSPLVYNSLVSPLFIGNVLGRTSLQFTSGKEPLAFWVPETLETGMTPIPPSNLTKRVVPLGREMNERDQRHSEQPFPFA